jgi:hypothetical protein
MEEDGRPGSWYIAAAQQGQICSVVISLPSATTARRPAVLSSGEALGGPTTET